MPMKTPEQYVESLRDGHALYMNGRKTEDVTEASEFEVPIAYASRDYNYDDRPDLLDSVPFPGSCPLVTRISPNKTGLFPTKRVNARCYTSRPGSRAGRTAMLFVAWASCPCVGVR